MKYKFVKFKLNIKIMLMLFYAQLHRIPLHTLIKIYLCKFIYFSKDYAQNHMYLDLVDELFGWE